MSIPVDFVSSLAIKYDGYLVSLKRDAMVISFPSADHKRNFKKEVSKIKSITLKSQPNNLMEIYFKSELS